MNQLLLTLAIVTGVVGVVIYNRLVQARHRVLAAWSDIDVQLKRRHDLIPKLISVVQQYADYEPSTFADIVTLRQRGQQAQAIAERSAVETQLDQQLHNLFALVENYPALRAIESFQQLQSQITEVENNIQYARRFYNGAVRLLNTRIDSFPDMFLARLFRFTPAEYFQLENTQERNAPEIN